MEKPEAHDASDPSHKVSDHDTRTAPNFLTHKQSLSAVWRLVRVVAYTLLLGLGVVLVLSIFKIVPFNNTSSELSGTTHSISVEDGLSAESKQGLRSYDSLSQEEIQDFVTLGELSASDGQHRIIEGVKNKLLEGVIIELDEQNRFMRIALMDERIVSVHVPDEGILKENGGSFLFGEVAPLSRVEIVAHELADTEPYDYTASTVNVTSSTGKTVEDRIERLKNMERMSI